MGSLISADTKPDVELHKDILACIARKKQEFLGLIYNNFIGKDNDIV